MDEIKNSFASSHVTFSIYLPCTTYWKRHIDKITVQKPFILSIQEINYWVGSMLLSLLRKPLEISLTEILLPSVSFKNVDEEFSFIGNITQLRYNTNN